MSSYQVNPLEILDTTNSTGVGSGGSLTVGGGVAVGRDLYVGGAIAVSGTTTSFADNILVLNNNTLGSTDTGILLKRATQDVTGNNNYSGILYSEASDSFKFGYVTADTRGTLAINSLVPIESSGVTTGNINFTGNLYQNGVLYTGSSQWGTGAANSIFYTSGNVGISTTAPAYNLDVIGVARFTTSVTTGAVLASNSTITNAVHTTLTSGAMVITGGALNATFNSNTVGAIITTGGNVGVGTVTPSYKLDITGTLRATGGDITVGTLLATTSLKVSSSQIALGFNAGQSSQGTTTVAVGQQAGQTNQGGNAVAVGLQTGQTNQGIIAVAVGQQAGQTSQGSYAVAMGYAAGASAQGNYTVAVGSNAGNNNQSSSSVAIGNAAGNSSQGNNAVAMGSNAGNALQGQYAVAMGYQAGQSSQGSSTVAIGNIAGQNSQGNNAVAIGSNAGVTVQGSSAVAMGVNAGNTSQGSSAVALGNGAGQNNQGSNAVSMGTNAGQTSQNTNAVAMGPNAGQNSQGNSAVAMGTNAGQHYQGSSAVALGSFAGQTSQGNSTVALGNGAGQTNQGLQSVAMGYNAGQSSQSANAVAIGRVAGNISQGADTVAVGQNAGYNRQAAGAVAVGAYAGTSSQGSYAIAIGYDTARSNQGEIAVAVGKSAGDVSQGLSAIAVGNATGNSSQGNYAVSIGINAGNSLQGISSVAIGNAAGQISQTSQAVAAGIQAGQYYQGTNAVAIGVLAGNTSQGSASVAVGSGTGQTSQGNNAVAMGNLSGQNYQGVFSSAVGAYAGQNSQGNYAVAMGYNAGQTNQGTTAVAIGINAGNSSQGLSAVAIGNAAGNSSQGNYAVAIGAAAGQSSQGSYAVAIGHSAGQTNQHTNSIVLNASSTALNSETAGAFYVSSIRNVTQANVLGYDTTAKEVTYFSLANQTSTNIVATNISSASLYSTTGSFGTVSSSLISATTMTGGSMSLSGNLNVAGTLTVVNITSTNLMDTNLTAGIARITTNLAATGNSNTIGNIITTGGNVGINTTAPSAKLDILGNMKISSGTESYIYDVTGGTYMYMNAVSTSPTSGYARLGGYSTVSDTQALSLQPAGGNVGVGTTSPNYTLDINGNMRVSDASISNMLVSGNLNATSNSNTIGPIITTGGNVGVGTIVPSFKLDVSGNARISTGITTNTLLASTNISTGLLQATSIGSIVLTSTSIVGTVSTIGTLRVTTFITTSNLAAGLITSASMQVNTILANTSITTANLLVTTNTSMGQLGVNNITSNNLIVNTLVSSANIQSVLMTTGTLLSNLITTNNLIATNITSGLLVANNANITNLTISNSVNTNISASNFVGGSYSGTNINISGTTASTVYTGGSMSLSGNLTIGGTLIYVNTTNDNYVYTNVTATTLRVTSSLSSVTNTNTIGNIFTTGGNVGIGYTAPSYLLDINGSVRSNSINLKGVSSGNISISAPAVAGTQNYIFPAAVPTSPNYVMSSNSSGTLNWVSPHHIGDMAARQIDNTFLEMNGQIVNQGSYGTLFTSLGHQPEFKFSVTNLEKGIYANQNIQNSNNLYGKNNIGRNGSNIIAVGSGGLLYSSTDDGVSWNQGSCAVFGTTAINLSGYFGGTWNRWIIGANGNNLLADSTDGGKTWLNRGAGNVNRWDYAFNEGDSVGIFVGSGGSIFRSTNGTTWAQTTYTAIGTTTVGTATLRCAGFADISGTKAFVCGGDGGVIIYSTDNAATWTQVSDITNTLVFNKVMWVGGSINQFVLGGNTNILFTSPDGINWTQRTVTTVTNIQDIAVDENNEYIVIGGSGGIAYSTNATTWTSSAFTGGILSVSYDVTNSKFVGVGDSRYYYASKSSIGTWNTVNSLRNKIYKGTCTSNGGGKIYAFSDGGGVIEFNTSTNTDVLRVAPGYNLIDVAYGNGIYVALVKDADSSIYTSTDGITWTYRRFNTTTTNYGFTGRRIRYLNNTFIILSTSTVIFTSTDGITWTERSTANTTKNNVVWTGTYYVIACDGGTILYSSNLSTWTTVNVFTSAGLMTSTSVNVNDITHLGSGTVLCACSAGWIFRSTDHGVTWSGIQPPDVGPYPFVDVITDSSTNIVSVTREGTIISYSNDSGATWSTYKAPTTAASALFTGVAYGGGKFVVYGRNSVLGVSEDNGATWDWNSMGGHFEIIDMGYGDGFFVGAGLLNSTTAYATPIVVWSPDGKNWTQRAVPHSMVDTTLTPKQRINYVNKNWMIASNVTLRSSNVWNAPYPYDISTQFQIPTHYLGSGINKMWIKSLDV